MDRYLSPNLVLIQVTVSKKKMSMDGRMMTTTTTDRHLRDDSSSTVQ